MFVQSHLNIIFDCFTGDNSDSYMMIEKLYSLWGDVFEIWNLYGDGYYNHGFWAMMLCTSVDRYQCFEELTFMQSEWKVTAHICYK